MPEIPNVITGEPVASEWGNQIRDRTLQRYTSSIQRNTLHPTPAAGDMSYLGDTGAVEVFHSGAWRAMLPTGVVLPYAGTAAPAGFLICNGAAVSRTTYAALFGVLGTAFGAGDGTTTFGIPDMRQRFPLGVAASGTGSVRGVPGGQIDHSHSITGHAHSMGTHTHTFGAHTHTVNPPEQPTTSDGAHTHAVGSHSHSVSDATGGPSQSMGVSGGAGSAAGVSHTHSFSGSTGGASSTAASAGSHSHTFNMGILTSSSDGNGTTSGVDPGDTNPLGTLPSGTGNPPFLALHYIIRI